MNQYFNFLASGLLIGVVAGSLWPLGYGLALLTFFSGLTLAAIAFLSPAARPGLIIAAVIAVAFSLGLVRTERVWQTAHRLDEYLDQVVKAQAVVVETEERESSRRVTFKLSGQPVKVIASFPLDQRFKIGDLVQLTGRLQAPAAFQMESGRIFNYPYYLAARGIFYELDHPVAELTGWSARLGLSYLARLKERIISDWRRLIPEPGAGLLAGMALGEKSALSREWNDRFLVVGLSHIIVLSGYNLSVVAGAVLAVFGIFLPRRTALLLSATAIIAFALMAGGGASVFRATVMALLVILSRAAGRIHLAGRALLLAGLGLLFFQPLALLYDLGFQLSFLATWGIIYGVPVLEPIFARYPNLFGLKEIFLTTVAAQAAVLPLILYQTGNLSPWALPVNLLVLPVVPLIMTLGFWAGLISLLARPFGLLLAWPTHLLLKYVLIVSAWIASWPAARLILPPFPWPAVVLAYGGLYLGYYWLKNKKPAAQLKLLAAGQKIG